MSRTIIKKEDILFGLSACQHFSKIIRAVIIVTFFYFYRFHGVSYFCNLSCIICPDIMVDEMQSIQDTQKERPRQHDPRRHSQNQKQVLPTEKPAELKEAGLDDDETEEDRTSSHPRTRHGGRPEKKVYEEWASDPYCE